MWQLHIGTTLGAPYHACTLPPRCFGREHRRSGPGAASVRRAVNSRAVHVPCACMQAADVTAHRRLPQKLVASWRHGYGAVRSKTFAAPHKLIALLRPCLLGATLSFLPPPAAPPADPAERAVTELQGGRPGESPGSGTLDGGNAGSTDGRPAEESLGSQRGNFDSGSQGSGSAAVSPAALEEVVDAITTSVVAQVCPSCPCRGTPVLHSRVSAAHPIGSHRTHNHTVLKIMRLTGSRRCQMVTGAALSPTVSQVLFCACLHQVCRWSAVCRWSSHQRPRGAHLCCIHSVQGSAAGPSADRRPPTALNSLRAHS